MNSLESAEARYEKWKFCDRELGDYRTMESITLREIAVNCAYQLGFYIVMRRSYNTKKYGYVKGFDEAKISTLVNVLRSLLAGCPQFSREVAVWIKKGIEGARI